MAGGTRAGQGGEGLTGTGERAWDTAGDAAAGVAWQRLYLPAFLEEVLWLEPFPRVSL